MSATRRSDNRSERRVADLIAQYMLANIVLRVDGAAVGLFHSRLRPAKTLAKDLI
jgi:hypothetical protein